MASELGSPGFNESLTIVVAVACRQPEDGRGDLAYRQEGCDPCEVRAWANTSARRPPLSSLSDA